MTQAHSYFRLLSLMSANEFSRNEWMNECPVRWWRNDDDVVSYEISKWNALSLPCLMSSNVFVQDNTF